MRGKAVLTIDVMLSSLARRMRRLLDACHERYSALPLEDVEELAISYIS